MQIIYTELKDTLEYTCDINVFNVSMIMRVSYNSRSKKRLISLTSLDGSILYLKPTYITYGSRIFPNFNTIIDGLSFYITLDRLTLTGDNYLNWSNQFRLCFVEYIPFEKGEGWYLAENSLEENALTPNFGEWLIKPDDITVENNNILYQAYKTNSILTYDSFATFSLETALIRSFHDTDMQQWQGFKDAVNELTGVTDWIVDNVNNRVNYIIPDSGGDWLYYFSYGNDVVAQGYSAYSATKKWYDWNCETGNNTLYCSPKSITCTETKCRVVRANGFVAELTPSRVASTTEPVEAYVPFTSISAKILSNTSSLNEGISLLAEAYIDEVLNSINNTDLSKQFVSMLDLVDQFEENKTLRS